ncbi:MAG: FAD-binding oxidoreductase [Pseudomonadota bacterium]
MGGGVVGAAVLYWLTRLGWTDVLLLERRRLTSGSTWHAAGNTTFFGHWPQITPLFINSIKTYVAAGEESGQDIGLHRSGSLRLATNDAELAAYRRLIPAYETLETPYAVVSPEEAGALHPLLNVEGLLGAAHTPTDGHVDAAGATEAMAKAARQRGAEVRLWSPVRALRPAAGRWIVETEEETYIADHVVCATSFWTRELLAPLGIDAPLYPVQHHEIVTEDHPDLAALGFEAPTIRDPVAPANIRQERNGFLCGIYETNPEFWATDGIPADFVEEYLPSDPDRLEPHLMKVIERLPAFGEAGVKAINNGPICYSPDGLPLLGPAPDAPGLWLAAGFAIGIGTGGGSAEFLARWMTDGAPPTDLPTVHPSRFAGGVPKDAALDRIRKTYAAGYALPEIA